MNQKKKSPKVSLPIRRSFDVQVIRILGLDSKMQA
jgi:hypothetical protein